MKPVRLPLGGVFPGLWKGSHSGSTDEPCGVDGMKRPAALTLRFGVRGVRGGVDSSLLLTSGTVGPVSAEPSDLSSFVRSIARLDNDFCLLRSDLTLCCAVVEALKELLL